MTPAIPLQVERITPLGDGSTRITLKDCGDVLTVEDATGRVRRKHWTPGGTPVTAHLGMDDALAVAARTAIEGVT